MNTKVKKRIKKALGTAGYNVLREMYRKSKPKQKTDKPVAFLFGFSDWKHPHMEAYLIDYEVNFVQASTSYSDIITDIEQYQDKVLVVWGYKDNSRIREYAKQHNIPYYRVEDGFVRSVQLGAAKSVPLSICMDSQVLYYDATQRSDLEDILNTYDFQVDTELMTRAENCIQLLKDLNISKYNNVSQKDINEIYGEKTKRRILVIGQVEDDESIKRGCSRKMTNNDLVWAAVKENPDAEVIYKPHPDVLFGKRAMQSNPDDVRHIAKVITEPLSLVDSFQTIDHVYTITSLSGFEALLRGISVTTMGAPFYSGWGLTDDRQIVSRRTRTLTVEELFAAAYILYPRYLNPFTKQPITLEEAIQTLQFMRETESKKQEEAEGKPLALLVGFNRQRAAMVQQFFPEYEYEVIAGSISSKAMTEELKKSKNVHLFIWKDAKAERFLTLAKENKVPCYIIENGLLQSEDLNTASFPEISLAMDTKKLSSDNELSELTHLLNTYEIQNEKELLARTEQVIEKTLKTKQAKYRSILQADIEGVYGEKTKKRILVLGQDESRDEYKVNPLKNEDLIWAAKLENPDAQIIYKPHPENLKNREEYAGRLEAVSHVATVLHEPFNIYDALETIDHVYTIDSLGGFEALLRGIEVTVFGTPFYAGWGLTNDRAQVPNRQRKLSVKELFAIAYIVYPKYMNPFTKQFISIEQAIELLNVVRETERQRIAAAEARELELLEQQKQLAEMLEELSSIYQPKPELLEIPGEVSGKIGVLSKGMQEILNLQSFLKGELVFNPKENPEELQYVAGWGMKPSAQKALAFCREHDIPYLGLEDGFLRSVGLGVEGSPPLSVCIDHIGIYYDATRPSRLENILNSSGWEDEALLRQARAAMNLIRQNYLSKYNHAPMIDSSIFSRDGRQRVLVVDQTLGDMSITLGLADQERFKEMYRTARAENPDAHIYIKTHPDVISGKKQGNITDIEIDVNTTFIYEDCNPLSLIENVDKVYVVTSQFGFEALMMDKEVHCFGMPFYAGWGITKDRLTVDRRTKRRTVEEVFAAAYILYPRYINPRAGQPGSIFEVIQYLVENKPQYMN